jgi:hypothetical protein
MNSTTDLVIGMAGSGGDGIVSAGESLVAAAAHEGYHAMMTKSFGSQIRGGESSCRVRLSTREVLNPGGNLDVAVALNWDDFLPVRSLPPFRLDLGSAAVDEQFDTRDETGVIRRQKQRRLGNFLGFPHTSHRDGGHKPRNHVCRLPTYQRRIDRTRTNNV